MSAGEEPWIEFLDDEEQGAAPEGPPAPQAQHRRGPWPLLGALAAAAVLVLAGSRLASSGSPASPSSEAGAEQPAPLTFVTGPTATAVQQGPWIAYGPPPAGGYARCDGGPIANDQCAQARQAAAAQAVAQAVSSSLRMPVVSQSGDYAGALNGRSQLIDRHVEADNGAGTHVIIDVTRNAAAADAINRGPGATVVRVVVESDGYAVSLVAIGPTGRVPSKQQLEALGRDPRLLA